MYSPGEKIIRFMKGPNFKNMILNIGKWMNIPHNSCMVLHPNHEQCSTTLCNTQCVVLDIFVK